MLVNVYFLFLGNLKFLEYRESRPWVKQRLLTNWHLLSDHWPVLHHTRSTYLWGRRHMVLVSTAARSTYPVGFLWRRPAVALLSSTIWSTHPKLHYTKKFVINELHLLHFIRPRCLCCEICCYLNKFILQPRFLFVSCFIGKAFLCGNFLVQRLCVLYFIATCTMYGINATIT